MANNELIYRAVREALDDSTTVHEVLIDIEDAIASYGMSASERDPETQRAVLDEMRMGRHALGHLSRTLDWLAKDEPEREAAVRELLAEESLPVAAGGRELLEGHTAEEVVRFVIGWGRDPEDADYVDDDLAVNGYDDHVIERIAADLRGVTAVSDRG